MSQTTLESLLIFPDEILSSVFFHLLIEDRKSVRLTCRRFYEACNTFDILKTEEFNFYGNINSNRAILSLFNVKRKLLNIKINAVRLDSSILPFFGKHGPHIHSLIFHNCMLTDGLLRDIIECCQNMCSFAFIIAVPNRMNHWWDNRLRVMYKLNILADLIALHNNGVVCTQVTKFTLILPRPFPLDNVWDFSNDKFLHIFDVFPNIQKLNIQVDVNSDFHQLSTIMSDVTSDRVFSFSSIYYQIMKMCNQLEKLTLHFLNSMTNSSYSLTPHSYYSVQTLNKIGNIKLKNLKELSLNLIRPDFSDVSLINIFSFENLTCLDCTVENVSSNDMLLILDTAKKLCCLTLRTKATDHTFLLHEKCFEALVISKLIILDICRATTQMEPMILSVSFDHSSLSNTSLPNRTLKQLKMSMANDNTISLFLSCFKHLETLLVGKVENNFLNVVSKNQTQLRNLILYHRHRSRNLLHSPLQQIDTPSCQKFDNLTHLCILYVDSQYSKLSILMLSKLLLPKLISLHIQLELCSEKSDHFERLWQSIQKFTQLEYLTIILNYHIEFPHCLTLINVLPKLRYIHIWDKRSFFYDSEDLNNFGLHVFRFSSVDDLKCHQIFDLHPSLRIVILHHFSSLTKASRRYSKDITKNEVILKWLHLEDEKLEGIPYYYYNFLSHYVPMYIE